MMRTLFLLALMAVISLASPVSEHGKLSVKDGKLVDKNGQPYTLRGMSMFWNKWTEGSRFYKSTTVDNLANNWKANVVRVAVGDGNAQDAKNFMDWTNAAGIYVIADWHYHDTDLNGASNFFRTVSGYAKEKGYTHVLYEVFNEPIKQSWTEVKSYAESVIDVIRANDPDGIIIVGNPNYSADLASPRANPIAASKSKNVMYTLHFYTSDVNHNDYKTNLQSAYCNNFPVFATEWGTSQADGNGTQDWNLTNGWLSLIESLGTSWANWSITDKGESSAALSPGCCGGGTFGDNNLTASGKYVQTIMKNRNSGGAINAVNGQNSVNLTQQNIDCGNAAPKGQKTGIIKVGSGTTNSVDFLSMSGAKDSTNINSAYVLQNTASTFSVGYKITEIPGAGKYRLRLRYGSTAAVTVSWSSSGVESGSFELPSTGKLETWKNSDYIPLNITASPETPFNLTFNANGANNFAFVNLQVSLDPDGPAPSSASTPSSSSGGEDPDPTPTILPQPTFTNSLTALQNSISLQVARDANLKVFDLKGNIVHSLKLAQGNHTVSLSNLPKGLYIVKVQFGSQREIVRVPVR